MKRGVCGFGFVLITILGLFQIGCPGKSNPTNPPSSSGPIATSTFTAVCSSPATLGYPVIGSVAVPISGYLIANQYTVSNPATIYSLSVYLNLPAGPFELAIYSDASGYPGTLLAQSAATSPHTGWNQVFVPLTTLAPGTYWLAGQYSTDSFSTPDGGNYDLSGTGAWVTYTYGSFPTTFPATTLNARNLSIYANYCGFVPTPCGLPGNTCTPTLTKTPTFTPTVTNSPTATYSPSPTNSPTPSKTPTYTYTPAPTSYCGNNIGFGYQSNGTIIPGYVSGYYFWETAHLTEAATLTGIQMETTSNPGGGNVRVAVYDSNKNLVTQSAPQVPQAGWNPFPLTYSYLAPGTYYLAFQFEPVTGGPSSYETAYSGVTYYGVAGGWGPFPSTLPSTGLYSSIAIFSIYAQYCPVVTYTPTPTITPTVTPAIHWTEATAAAAFPARRGHVALVFNPSTGTSDGTMWVIGGFSAAASWLGDVWSSTDGVQWTQTATSAGFAGKQMNAGVVYNGNMWVFVDNGTTNESWYSSDGANWTQATADMGIGNDTSYPCAVFDNGSGPKMWITQGNNGGKNAWASSDGVTWTLTSSSVGMVVRTGHNSLGFNNTLWVMGGSIGGILDSSDGVSWTYTVPFSGPPFVGADLASAVVYNSLMWVMGGYSIYGALNQVWASPDGKNWYEETPSAEFSPRFLHASVVFNNELWVIGGYDGSNYLNDTWHSP